MRAIMAKAVAGCRRAGAYRRISADHTPPWPAGAMRRRA